MAMTLYYLGKWIVNDIKKFNMEFLIFTNNRMQMYT